jgi:hypothetical protein
MFIRMLAQKCFCEAKMWRKHFTKQLKGTAVWVTWSRLDTPCGRDEILNFLVFTFSWQTPTIRLLTRNELFKFMLFSKHGRIIVLGYLWLWLRIVIFYVVSSSRSKRRKSQKRQYIVLFWIVIIIIISLLSPHCCGTGFAEGLHIRRKGHTTRAQCGLVGTNWELKLSILIFFPKLYSISKFP